METGCNSLSPFAIKQILRTYAAVFICSIVVFVNIGMHGNKGVCVCVCTVYWYIESAPVFVIALVYISHH